MTADKYLQSILQREAIDTGLFSPVLGVQGQNRAVPSGVGRNFFSPLTPGTGIIGKKQQPRVTASLRHYAII